MKATKTIDFLSVKNCLNLSHIDEVINTAVK